jgi:uncharacterized phage-associated protein
MEKSLCVAKALYDMYFEQNGTYMDQMKMHKLMYFSQRESLMYNHEALFTEEFYGWKYGPVLKSVRSEYMKKVPFHKVDGSVSPRTTLLLKNVLKQYGNVSSWKLSSLSHNEFSWKMARKGLNASENGDVQLSLDAMKVDATRELAFRN